MIKVICGDSLEQLRNLPAGSVQCCVTSPPYWNLRDYGVTGQLGLESTPEAYITRMVEVFRELRRVLCDDGTLWVNIGDSYFGDSPTRNRSSEVFSEEWDKSQTRSNGGNRRSAARIKDLKPKDLIGIPWMLAFALRNDGWYLRQDIIWAKPSCMPESVKDRCTRAHEYIFMFSKNRKYFYNADAIAEPAIYFESESKYDNGKNGMEGGMSYAGTGSSTRKFGNARKIDKQRGHSRRHDGFNDRWDAMEKKEQCSGMRNKRSVWTIGPDPFPEAHFATFPEELPTLCILAGSKEDDVILDPFAGAGTTGLAALKLGRSAILIDLNPKYIEMIHKRIYTEIPMIYSEHLEQEWQTPK